MLPTAPALRKAPPRLCRCSSQLQAHGSSRDPAKPGVSVGTECPDDIQHQVPLPASLWGGCFLLVEGAKQTLSTQLPVLRAAPQPRYWVDIKDGGSWTVQHQCYHQPRAHTSHGTPSCWGRRGCRYLPKHQRSLRGWGQSGDVATIKLLMVAGQCQPCVCTPGDWGLVGF